MYGNVTESSAEQRTTTYQGRHNACTKALPSICHIYTVVRRKRIVAFTFDDTQPSVNL